MNGIHRVVFDTNILFSAVGWVGNPHWCVQAARQGKCHALTCEPILAELAEKLQLKRGLDAGNGASRSCRWFLPLLPRREERAGERRPVSSARHPLSPTLSPSDGAREKPPADYSPTNNFGMHGAGKAAEITDEIRAFCTVVSIPGTLKVIADDPDDDAVLECASLGKRNTSSVATVTCLP